MKKYPHIEYWNKGIFGTQVYAFDKLDGSNFRASWSKKLSKKTSFTNGFGKFGTKNQLTYLKDPVWGLAVEIFMKKYSSQLDKIFSEDKYFKNINDITIFAEFFGPNSFAGKHTIEDRKNNLMNVILFDVDIYKKGFMKPKDFVHTFENLEIPKIVYQGYYDNKLVEDVKNNKFGLNEGVVVKGITKSKKDVENVWMTKIKCDSWLQKLKQIYGDKKLLEEVNGDIDLMKNSLL